MKLALVFISLLVFGCGTAPDQSVENRELPREQSDKDSEQTNTDNKDPNQGTSETTAEAETAENTNQTQKAEQVIEKQLSDFEITSLGEGRTRTIEWEASSYQSMTLASPVTYHLYVSQNTDCTNATQTYEDITTTIVELEELDFGVYYVCVFAEAEEKEKEALNSGIDFEVERLSLAELNYLTDGMDFIKTSEFTEFERDMEHGISFTDSGCTGSSQLFRFIDGVIEKIGDGKINVYSKKFWIDNGCQGY